MDDLTLDFSEFGSDPLLGGEETDPLDPFPPQDEGSAPVRVVLLSLDQAALTPRAAWTSWPLWPKPTAWKPWPP